MVNYFLFKRNTIDSGWIYKVSDISGMPILRVHSDGVVALRRVWWKC